MSSLRTLTKAKLDEWLTRELRLVPGCEDCVLQITDLTPDAGPEECNWAPRMSLVHGRNPDRKFCATHAAEIGERARQRFRVAD